MRRLLTDRLRAAAAALLLAVGITAGIGAAGRLGEPFPGFLVLENRVVPSVGLSLWPATAGGEIFQHEIVSIGGRPVATADEITTIVRGMPVGTPLEVRFRRNGRELVRTIETRRFGGADFLLLYGLYALNGVALGAAGLVALAARRRNPAAGAAAPALLVSSLWALSALDLYGPYRLFAVHAACESLLFASALHMALGFPPPSRRLAGWPWLVPGIYAAGAAGALVTVATLGSPRLYTGTHLVATTAFGIALLALVVAEVERFRCATSLAMRERVRVIALGAGLALALPIVLTVAELFTGGRSPVNAVALTGWIFPAAVAYAASREERALAPALRG
jgi:hypothetical protein